MIATDKLKMYAAYVPDSMEEWDWDPETYSKILLRDMALELMAAREVVQCVKDVYSGKYLTGASDKWKSLIEKYDEARQE